MSPFSLNTTFSRNLTLTNLSLSWKRWVCTGMWMANFIIYTPDVPENCASQNVTMPLLTYLGVFACVKIYWIEVWSIPHPCQCCHNIVYNVKNCQVNWIKVTTYVSRLINTPLIAALPAKNRYTFHENGQAWRSTTVMAYLILQCNDESHFIFFEQVIFYSHGFHNCNYEPSGLNVLHPWLLNCF